MVQYIHNAYLIIFIFIFTIHHVWFNHNMDINQLIPSWIALVKSTFLSRDLLAKYPQYAADLVYKLETGPSGHIVWLYTVYIVYRQLKTYVFRLFFGVYLNLPWLQVPADVMYFFLSPYFILLTSPRSTIVDGEDDITQSWVMFQSMWRYGWSFHFVTD